MNQTTITFNMDSFTDTKQSNDDKNTNYGDIDIKIALKILCEMRSLIESVDLSNEALKTWIKMENIIMSTIQKNKTNVIDEKKSSIKHKKRVL